MSELKNGELSPSFYELKEFIDKGFDKINGGLDGIIDKMDRLIERLDALNEELEKAGKG